MGFWGHNPQYDRPIKKKRRRPDDTGGRQAGRRRAEPPGGRRRAEPEGGSRRRAADPAAEGGRRAAPEGRRAAPEGGRRRAEGERRTRSEAPPPGGRRRAAAADGAMRSERPEGGRRRAESDRRLRTTDPGEPAGRRRAGSESRHGSGPGGRRRPDDDHRRPRGRAADPRGRARRKKVEEDDDRGPVRRFFARAWKPALGVMGLGFVGAVGLLGVAYATTPGADELRAQADAESADTAMYFGDETELATIGTSNRVPVEIEDVPEHVQEAVIAAEQQTFRTDPAISIPGLARVVYNAIATGGSRIEGASTITQQMARNYYETLSQDVSITRKLREIMISLRVEQSLSKDQILQQYLNTIYFGRQANGIESAAQAYFGTSVGELDVAQSAFMAALIQQPGNFENLSEENDAVREELEFRWNYVLDNMVESGTLSAADRAEQEFPEPIPYELGEEYAGQRGYMIEAVRNELRERYDLTDNEINVGGWQVHTTLDPALMEAAEEAVQNADLPENFRTGLTAIDPATGGIRAFYGGANLAEQADNSLYLQAQAGSSMKPVVLAAALERGISLESRFDGDSPQSFEGLQEPVNNAGNESHGVVDLVQATAQSVNTTYVQLAIEVTPDEVIRIGTEAGIRESQWETATPGPNIALGIHQVRAVDLASVYATFAAQGVHRDAHLIEQVLNREGEELEPSPGEEITDSQAFSAEVARDATFAMQAVVQPGATGAAAALPDGRPVAGKTGTSEEARSTWFAGYVPQLATAVGLFDAEGEALGDTYSGGGTSAEIWREFMTAAMDGEEVRQFDPPARIGTAQDFVPVEPSPDPSTETEPEPSPDPSTPSTSPDPTTPTPSSTPCEDEGNMWPPGCTPVEPDPDPSSTPPDGECQEPFPWQCEEQQNSDAAAQGSNGRRGDTTGST
ncbi:membrane peptidoglycan carboxypeptidase [Allonocardiopsis opalescens]|uniref:Membrane peptidoglycan carboxypeptidase n=2 Tax=Allonocardiopsis opalescens TaxID=1144618 RepID=A0A2T0Q6T6_9ACTN|nr:membrane peptidoglycan carboxypeptidase [Allonocardiopsis opalescens]